MAAGQVLQFPSFPKIFVIDGLPGSGKTTMIKHILNDSKFNDTCEVSEEPLHLWLNFLPSFYEDPTRIGGVFHAYVATAINIDERVTIKNAMIKGKKLIIRERDSLSVAPFVENLDITFVEKSMIYQSILIETALSVPPNSTFRIFLDTKPDKCLENIRNRNRIGEENITLDYLTKLRESMLSFLSDDDTYTYEDDLRQLIRTPNTCSCCHYKIIKVDQDISSEELYNDQVKPIISALLNKLLSPETCEEEEEEKQK